MRANNEGSIFKRADGRWTAAVSVGGGRRKFIYGKTREEVVSSMLDVQRSVRDGISVPSDRLTVRDFAQTWIETIRPTVAPKTYESYEFASFRLADISQMESSAFINTPS